MRAGVDTGGTFTDFAVLDGEGRLRTHKVPSTPDAPERAILAGLAALGLDPAGLSLVHGSTVAIVKRPSTISGQRVAAVSSAPNLRANSRPCRYET
jgi:hypothetical protein